MTKAHAGILESDDAQAAEEKLAQGVARLGLARSAPGSRATCGRSSASAREPPQDDRRNESFAAWRRFFEALAEQRPLVLVFEDLHWADDGCSDFIDHLADWATDVAILVVCTTRPELSSGASLGRREAQRGDDLAFPCSGSPRARAPARSAGRQRHPGDHLSRAAATRSTRRSTPGCSNQRGNARYRPPDSVQGMIAARLDTCSSEKTLVQDAAVLGKVFWIGAGPGVAARPCRRSPPAHALERKEFIRRERRSLADETAYVFRHILVRDVAYGQIPGRAESRSTGRPRTGSTRWRRRREDLADVVAHHYVSALELEQAMGRRSEPPAERARVALPATPATARER